MEDKIEHVLTETERLKFQNIALQRALIESQAKLLDNEMRSAQAAGRAGLEALRKRLDIPADAEIDLAQDFSRITVREKSEALHGDK